MSDLFISMNCDGCFESVMPALIFNNSLRLGEKIRIKDLSGNMREASEKLRGERFVVPQFVLENEKRGRVQVSPVLDMKTNHEFIKNFK